MSLKLSFIPEYKQFMDSYQIGNYEEAINKLEIIIHENSDYVDTDTRSYLDTLIARATYKLGDYESAVAIFNNAVLRDKTSCYLKYQFAKFMIIEAEKVEEGNHFAKLCLSEIIESTYEHPEDDFSREEYIKMFRKLIGE